ncbi:hypothetical protein [Mucilaginibacter lappiensis]|uniref:hypothetical protein n=1 Tax=Mucilaginibacter lappiensis TaxID=354630 RepID=UPI003D1D9AC0
MNTNNESSAALSAQSVQTAKVLRTLYFTRVGFSVVWVIALVTSLKSNPSLANALFIIYPLWDAVATWFDIKANPPEASKTPQYVNLAIGIVTTIAIALALQSGVPTAMMVIGAWAAITGIIQLILGLKRRKIFGGQWPMILSGGQSVLAGGVFIAMAHDPNHGISSLAGYSLFGAFYFLLAAIRLGKTIKAGPVTA